jgi:anti-anti-sigma factor
VWLASSADEKDYERDSDRRSKGGGVLFEVSSIKSITIVTLRTRQLTKTNCYTVRKLIAAMVDFKRPIVIDLCRTEYFDMSGLSLIVFWFSEARRMGGMVTMCSDSPHFHSLADLVRIASMTKIYGSVSEAVEACCQTTAVPETGMRSASAVRKRPAAAGGF